MNDHRHDDLANILDLDAQVFGPALRAVYEDIERAADAPVRTILDIGAGTGTGTFGLLQFFPDAHALAVDASAEMLAHLEQRAEHLGLGGRVVTRRADLDDEVPSVEPLDLAWASASLHHLTDPDRTLTELATLIRPGGLLAVLELDGLPRFLPDETPGGDAETRAQTLMTADRSKDMPTMGSDWGSRLTRAGLDVEQHRAITLELAPPTPELVGRYAAATLTRVRDAVADRLEPAELLAFDDLLDGGPHDVRHRDDLRVSAERWLWIARRTAL